jgi:hypothetical protein
MPCQLAPPLAPMAATMAVGPATKTRLATNINPTNINVASIMATAITSAPPRLLEPQSLKLVRVNSGETALEFVSSSSGLPVSDATSIVQGSTTSTKQLRFEVDGFTPATTRVVTPPDADITLAGQDYANLFTAAQTLQAQNEQRFADSDSSNYVGFKAPATISTNKIWTLPNVDSSGTQCLSSNGSATLGWSACSGGSGSPGGSDTEVQYNASSAFSGSPNFKFDYTNFRLRLQNLTTASDNATNMVQVSGTMPTSPSSTSTGLTSVITGAGSAGQESMAHYFQYAAGYTGASATHAVFGGNYTVSTGTTLNLLSQTRPTAAVGATGESIASRSGAGIGLLGSAEGNGPSIGVHGKAASYFAVQNSRR